jgi:hypothetical protein
VSVAPSDQRPFAFSTKLRSAAPVVMGTVRLALLLLCVFSSVSGQTQVTASLSQARYNLAGASALDTVAVFGGGETAQAVSNVLDVYHSNNGTWSALTLSVARSRLCAVGSSTDPRIFLAGGFGAMSDSNVVDIFNVTSNSLVTATLSVARYSLGCAYAGHLVLFAGGQTQSTNPVAVVDIFDLLTGVWTTTTLSAARWSLASASTATKAIFAGGQTSVAAAIVDIFDGPTVSWSVATLSAPRWALAAAAVGSLVYVVGGIDPSGLASPVVDVLDVPATGPVNGSSFMLTTARYDGTAVANAPAGLVAYGGGATGLALVALNDLSAYIAPGLLFAATLAQARFRLASASVGNILLFAGGVTVSGSPLALVDLVQVSVAASPPPATTSAAPSPPSSPASSPAASAAAPTPSSSAQATTPASPSTAPSLPPPTSSLSPCPCCQPPNAICDAVLRVWVLPSVANNAVLLLPPGSVISGTLTQVASGTLQLTSLSSAPALRVSGCASLAGSLELTIPQSGASSTPTNITVLTSASSCVQGQFSNVTVYPAPGQASCAPRALSQSVSPDGGSLLVLISSAGCSPAGGLGAGAIAGIVIAVIVAVALVTAVLVYKFWGSLRYRLRGDDEGAGNEYIISTAEKQHPL